MKPLKLAFVIPAATLLVAAIVVGLMATTQGGSSGTGAGLNTASTILGFASGAVGIAGIIVVSHRRPPR